MHRWLLLVVALVVLPSAAGAQTFGQFIQKADGAASANNATFGAAPTTGNLIVVFATNAAQATFTTPTGFTAGTNLVSSGGTARTYRPYWKISDGTETTVTVTNATGVELLEYAAGPNGFAATPADIENGNLTASSTSHATPTVTPTAALNALVVICFGVDSGSRTFSAEAVNGSSTGVTERVDNGVSPSTAACADLLVASTTGTYQGTATVSGAALIGGASIMVFKEGSGTPPTTTKRLLVLGAG